MSRKDIRDLVILSAVFTIVSVLISKLFKPTAKIVNKDDGSESYAYVGKNGAFVTNKKGGGFFSALSLFINVLYTLTNVALTVQMLKDNKKR
jgi:hypothetical protein